MQCLVLKMEGAGCGYPIVTSMLDCVNPEICRNINYTREFTPEENISRVIIV